MSIKPRAIPRDDGLNDTLMDQPARDQLFYPGLGSRTALFLHPQVMPATGHPALFNRRLQMPLARLDHHEGVLGEARRPVERHFHAIRDMGVHIGRRIVQRPDTRDLDITPGQRRQGRSERPDIKAQ